MEAVTSADARAGARARGERAGEILDAAALAPTPGSRKARLRHQLARTNQMRRHGRARPPRPTSARPRRADPVGRRAGGRSPREALPHRPAVGEREILDVGGAGVGGAHEHEHARAVARASATNGSIASLPISGLTVARSAPSPAQGAERRLGAAEQRLRVGGGAHRRCRRACRRRSRAAPARAAWPTSSSERRPARRSEPLEAGQLRLYRDAGRPGARRSARGSALHGPPRLGRARPAVAPGPPRGGHSAPGRGRPRARSARALPDRAESDRRRRASPPEAATRARSRPAIRRWEARLALTSRPSSGRCRR